MDQPILIVDDEAAIRETLKDVFEDEGYRVELVEDGHQALLALERVDPCVVILDLIMPVLDGLAVLERMRAEPRWADIPVVVSTSDPSRAPAGVLILRKPIKLDLLLDTVARVRLSPRLDGGTSLP